MKIYTKTGDLGETCLLGGQKVPKYHPLIEACGTIDELNTILGLALATELDYKLDMVLKRLQNELYSLSTDLVTPSEKNGGHYRIGPKHVQRLEKDIDRLESSLEEIKTSILPGGNIGAAYLHLGRTVCRRAERICFLCRKSEPVSTEALIFLNRLSDLLFVMARYQNKSKNIHDATWNAV